MLSESRFSENDIAVPGGRKSKIACRIDDAFTQRGWVEEDFRTQIVVDESTIDSPTHRVDCFRNGVALEIEWNNKDPFFDRDLNKFRLLFELRAVSVGIIITRSDDLQEIFDGLGRGSSYGQSTTHKSKLLPEHRMWRWRRMSRSSIRDQQELYSPNS